MEKNIKRIFNTGWINFKRNSYLSFAAVLVMSITLGLLLSLLSFQFLTSRVVSLLESKVDISAYMEITAPEGDILAVRDELEGLESVVSVEYISRDQALEEFRSRRSKDELIEESLEILGENPLTASLNITAIDTMQYASIANFLNSAKFAGVVRKVDFFENESVIKRIGQISGALNSWGLITVLVLAMVAVLVTFNTIRLTIYSQKQEIEIMRLVGASNWHIRGPYMVEGGYYGLIAAILALVVFYPIAYVVSGALNSFEPDVDLFGYLVGNVLQVGLLAVVVGAALGIISSMIAMRRHLKI